MQIKFYIKKRTIVRSVVPFFLFLLLIIHAGSPVLLAQQEGAGNNLLPEIDPQDIEIRSEFKARFPGLRRQPILGFNPNPRVYQVSPDREPFMESQEEVVASLPITDLSRPAPPPYPTLSYAPDLKLFGRLGVGSFTSPEAELQGYTPLSGNSYFGGGLDFHSSDGHLATQNSSFRYLDADAQFAAKLTRKTTLKISGGAQSHFNRLYELENRGTLPLQVPAGPKKEYDGYNGSVSLKNFQNTIEGWSLDARARNYNLAMDAGDLSGEARESVYGGTIRKSWAGRHIHEIFSIKAQAEGSSYRTDSLASGSWTTVQGGVEYRRLFDYQTQVKADLNLAYTSNRYENKVYPDLSAEIRYWLQDRLMVSGTLTAKPRVNTFEQLHQMNRFLNPEIPLRHTYVAKLGGQIRFEYFEGSSFFASVSYMSAANYGYFEKADLPVITGGTPVPKGYYTVSYGDATRMKGSAGVTHQLVPEKFWIHAEAYIQEPKLSDGRRIPYEEKWGLNSGVSLQLVKKLTISGWADYIGNRTTVSSGDLDGFLKIGSRVEVQVSDRIGVYAKLLNLLNQEYEIWSGYQERPFQAYGGITIKMN